MPKNKKKIKRFCSFNSDYSTDLDLGVSDRISTINHSQDQILPSVMKGINNTSQTNSLCHSFGTCNTEQTPWAKLSNRNRKLWGNDPQLTVQHWISVTKSSREDANENEPGSNGLVLLTCFACAFAAGSGVFRNYGRLCCHLVHLRGLGQWYKGAGLHWFIVHFLEGIVRHSLNRTGTNIDALKRHHY